MQIKKVFTISGMHCPSCNMLIEGELEDIGVAAKANYAKGIVEVEFDDSSIDEQAVVKAIEKVGYQLMAS